MALGVLSPARIFSARPDDNSPFHGRACLRIETRPEILRFLHRFYLDAYLEQFLILY
jgi:hypothetical protein